MKKIILASLLAMTGSVVFAATACDSGTSTTVTGDTTGATKYVRVSFKPVCSANSAVVYTDDVGAQKLYGGSASVKGASYFGGSTAGGAVKRVGACGANNTCGSAALATHAPAGQTAAEAFGASS